MIIGISGKLNSGKDTLGKMYQYRTSKYNGVCSYLEWDEKIFSNPKADLGTSFLNKKFAEKLKLIVCMFLNCTREKLEDRVFKDTVLGPEWWLFTDGISTASYLGGDTSMLDSYSISIQKTTPRLLLQLLGTEAGRNIIHPDIWVNSLMSEYVDELQESTGGNSCWVGKPNWVITDVRFPNEADAILEKGGTLIRINRPSVILDNKIEEHESERALDNYKKFTSVIDNSGSLQDLLEQVKFDV